MFGGFQVGPFQPFPAFQQEGAEQLSGGWERRRYFYTAYERELKRRIDEDNERRQRLEESEAIEEPISREIALLLRQQEAIDAERAELERLKRLVAQYGRDSMGDLSPRVVSAYTRALAQQNFSALQALDRELRRMMEEEEMAILMVLAMDD